MARHEHRVALGGPSPQQVPHLVDPLRVESVGRLVEDQHRRIAQQGAGKAEALSHPERVGTDPTISRIFEPHELEHLVHPVQVDPVGIGEDPQMVAPAATRMERVGLQERADDRRGIG